MQDDFTKKRKDLALEMAQLLYDIFKEQNDIIESGQNNAQQNLSN